MMSRRKLLQLLATVAAAPAATVAPPAALREGALVPAYFPPNVFPEEWERLADPRLHTVVLNIDSGPGPAPDPSFQTAVRRIMAAGGRPAAYVDVSYARRDPALVTRDLALYRAWYGVSDVFFDQAPATPAALPYMRAATETARTAGARSIILNHGTYPDPAYLSLADILITFEGPLSSYLSLTPPSWPRSHPRHRFCHLIHSCPPTSFAPALSLTRHHHAGLTYLTDRTLPNPYDLLPPYYPSLLTLATP